MFALLLALLAPRLRPVSCLNTSAATVSPQRLIDVTVERHGRIDCLVNNAGWRESTPSSNLQRCHGGGQEVA